jgi:peptide/nickel transport system substrate-binding protein
VVEKPSGELRVAVLDLHKETLDPIKGSIGNRVYIDHMYDDLVGMASDGTFDSSYGLATSWEMSPDGKTWTFHLREGMKFHNGAEITSEDVKFSIERNISEDSITTSARVLKKMIDKVEAPDRYTVVLRLTAPSGLLHWNFSPYEGDTFFYPKAYFEQVGADAFAKKPIGSGPWKFVERKVGRYILFEANEDYWGTVPKFKYLRIMLIPEDYTRTAMLVSGTADIVAIPKEFGARAEAAGFGIERLRNVSTITTWPFKIWDTDYVFSNKKVRTAFNIAIDKDAIIKNLLLGYGVRGHSNVFTPAADGYVPDLHLKQPYDPERAKQLLADGLLEFGWPKDKTLPINLYSFTMPGGPEVPTVNLALASYWEAMGNVKINIIPIDYATFRPKWRYWPMEFDPPGAIGTWNNSVQLSAVSRAKVGYVHGDDGGLLSITSAEIRNQVVDLWTRASQELDEAKRIELLKELNRLNVDNHVEFIIAHHDSIWALGKKVDSWEPMVSNIYTARFESATPAK